MFCRSLKPFVLATLPLVLIACGGSGNEKSALFEGNEPGGEPIGGVATPTSLPVPSQTPAPESSLSPAPEPTLAPAPGASLIPAPLPSLDPAPTPSSDPVPVPSLDPAPVPSSDPVPSPTFTPEPVNVAPLAVADFAEIFEDSVLLGFDVLRNDTDVNDDPLTVISVEADSGVAVLNEDMSINYTPVEDYNGDVLIEYILTDGQLSVTGSLEILVLSVIDDPDFTGIRLSIQEDTPANDIDALEVIDSPDAEIESISSVTADIGRAIVTNNLISYAPEQDYNGPVVLEYTFSNGVNDFTNQVLIDVLPVNDAPEARNDETIEISEDTSTALIDVVANDIDVDDDTLEITSASADSGEVFISDNQMLTFTPDEHFNGEALITYSVTDGSLTSEAEFTISVSAVNDAPVAVDDEMVVIKEDVTSVIDSLTDNDIDVDGDALSIIRAGATEGSAQIEDGVRIRYVPPEDFHGEVTISYIVTDDPDEGEEDRAVFNLVVTPVNDAPTTEALTLTVDGDSSGNLMDLSAAVSDIDGETFKVVSASVDEAFGEVTVEDGELLYTPADGYRGNDVEISYVIEDDTSNVDSEFAADNPVLQANGLLNVIVVSVDGSDVQVSWNIPALRYDGSAVDAGHIQGFEIIYRSLEDTSYQVHTVADGDSEAATIGGFSAGEYEFRITAYDEFGGYSKLSDPVTVEVF